MTDKEREKQIDEIVEDLHNNKIELREFVQNSIQQDERVQGLEKKLKTERNLYSVEADKNQKQLLDRIKLKKQNKRYREVLSYVVELDCIAWKRDELAEMARKALAGESNE